MPPLRVEYAKSGRSKCTLKECSKLLDKGQIRIGTGTLMPGADELSYKWRHVCCFTKRQLASVPSVDGIEGYDDLSEADQGLLRRMVRGELIGKFELVAETAPAVDPAAAAKASPKKRARAAGDAVVVVAAPVAAAPAAVVKAPCEFGASCYRTNPAHLRDFSHPRAAAASLSPAAAAPVAAMMGHVTAAPVASDAAATVAASGGCKFGDACFRADPIHRRQFHGEK